MVTEEGIGQSCIPQDVPLWAFQIRLISFVLFGQVVSLLTWSSPLQIQHSWSWLAMPIRPFNSLDSSTFYGTCAYCSHSSILQDTVSFQLLQMVALVFSNFDILLRYTYFHLVNGHHGQRTFEPPQECLLPFTYTWLVIKYTSLHLSLHQ